MSNLSFIPGACDLSFIFLFWDLRFYSLVLVV